MSREPTAMLTPMDAGEKALYRQIHPATLLIDIASAFFAVVLLWQQQLIAGVIMAIAPPLATSFAVTRWANLEPYKNSSLGRYVAKHMTANAQSLRLLGLLVTCLGAWYHVVIVMMIGVGMIAVGWARGLLSPSDVGDGAE
jgi:hypothetical protein